MIYLALILLLVGLLASAFGFGSLASVAIGAAKGLIFLKVVSIILILAAVAFAVGHLMRGRSSQVL